jgi:hypothetical protein
VQINNDDSRICGRQWQAQMRIESTNFMPFLAGGRWWIQCRLFWNPPLRRTRRMVQRSSRIGSGTFPRRHFSSHDTRRVRGMAGAQASGSGSTAYTKAVEFPADFHGCICALGCYTLFSVNPALDTIVRAAGSRGLTAVDFRKAKLGAIFEHATDRGRPRTSRSLFDQEKHKSKSLILHKRYIFFPRIPFFSAAAHGWTVTPKFRCRCACDYCTHSASR